MEIFAQDVHNHKANRITFSSQDEVFGDKEYQLDTEPEYPAKAMTVPPFIFPGDICPQSAISYLGARCLFLTGFLQIPVYSCGRHESSERFSNFDLAI